jgi:outer membrane protein assembly factor BamA
LFALFISWLIALSTPLQARDSKTIVIPALYYTPETELASGAIVMHIYPSASSPLGKVRNSMIQPSLIYTARKQTLAAIWWQHYFANYRVTLWPKFARYPDYFYGVGNDAKSENRELYLPIEYTNRLLVERLFGEHCSLGLGHQYERYDVKEREVDGLLTQGTLIGETRSVASSLFTQINYDTRDHFHSPYSGTFFRTAAYWANEGFASTYDYQQIETDYRHYFPLPTADEGPTVLAFHLVTQHSAGEVPFRHLPGFGGVYMMRGYYQGRYRDRNLIVGESELRFPIFGEEWRGAVFLGTGQVAYDLDDFDLDGWHHAGGAGLRYLLDLDRRVTLRFDVGRGADGTGIYFSIHEAY